MKAEGENPAEKLKLETDGLLNDEDSDTEEETSRYQDIIIFLQQIIPSFNISLMIAAPALMDTFGYRLMGRIGTVHDINGLGMWALSYNFTQPFYVGVQEKLNFAVSYQMGEGRYDKVRKTFIHGLISLAFNFIFIYLTMILNCGKIVQILGSTPEVADFAKNYFPSLLFADILTQYRQQIVIYSISQKKSNIIGLISIVVTVISIPLLFYFEISWKLGIWSFVYAKILNESMFMIIILIFTYSRNVVGPFTLEDFTGSLPGLLSFYYDSFKFTLTLFVDKLGRAISVVMCIQLKKPKEISAYNILIHIGNYTSFYGQGFSVTSRTEINTLLGMKKKVRAKRVFQVYIVGLFIASCVLGGIIYLCRNIIAGFFTMAHPEITTKLTELISILGIFLICSITFYGFTMSITRMMKQLTFLMYLQLIIMILLQSILLYALVFIVNLKYEIGAVHIMVCSNCLHMILLSILLIRVNTIPWDM